MEMSDTWGRGGWRQRRGSPPRTGRREGQRELGRQSQFKNRAKVESWCLELPGGVRRASKRKGGRAREGRRSIFCSGPGGMEGREERDARRGQLLAQEMCCGAPPGWAARKGRSREMGTDGRRRHEAQSYPCCGVTGWRKEMGVVVMRRRRWGMCYNMERNQGERGKNSWRERMGPLPSHGDRAGRNSHPPLRWHCHQHEDSCCHLRA